MAAIGPDAPLTWNVTRTAGTAAEFHGRSMPDVIERSVWIHDVSAPALVLGSSQKADVADVDTLAACGVTLVHRRSGGGAVLLIPGEVLWLDVVLPQGDPLWQEDIGRSTRWLGEVWADALGGSAAVHRGGMVRNVWSGLACFAGLGPGEVLIGARKVVGISQRRTRAGARFQCAIYRSFDAVLLPTFLHLSKDDRLALSQSLSETVATSPFALATVEQNFLAALP